MSNLLVPDELFERLVDRYTTAELVELLEPLGYTSDHARDSIISFFQECPHAARLLESDLIDTD